MSFKGLINYDKLLLEQKTTLGMTGTVAQQSEFSP